MKRLFIMVLSSVVFSLPAFADNDKPTSVDQMPVKSQKFIATHFAGANIALAKQEGSFIEKGYDVIFVNGDKVEFNRHGEWTNVDCKYSSVPQAIIPAQILGYVEQHFPGVKITQIEKEDRRYEVELSNGVDLEFNRSLELTNVDL